MHESVFEYTLYYVRYVGTTRAVAYPPSPFPANETFRTLMFHGKSNAALQWRVIYRVVANVLQIQVVDAGRVNFWVERAKVFARALKCHPAVLLRIA